MLSLPELFLPKLKHFGLAIGRSSIRAVEVVSKGKVRTFIEIPFPEAIFEDGILLKKDVFVDLLKELLQKGKFTTPYLAVNFSEIYVYSRGYSLPIIPKDEISEAVSWHVKDLFPYPEEDIYYDWKILETHEKEYEIAVIAVPKNILDPLVSAIISVGLKPLCFEPGASAIARLLDLKPHQQVIVVEINTIGAYVTLVDGGKSLFTTVVNYVKNENFENYLQSIIQTIDEVLEYFIKKEIVKSNKLNYVLTGELATDEILTKIQTLTTNQIQIFRTPIPNPAFNKAYASAIAKINPPYDSTSINLLPIIIQKRYDSERQQAFYTNILIRLLVVVLLSITLSITSFIVLHLERQRIEQSVIKTQATTKTKRPDIQKLLLLNAQAKSIVELAPLRQNPQDKLLVIASIIPSDITISQWEYNDAKLLFTLSGNALKRESLLEFKAKLEETEEFTKVTLPLGTLESPENIQFTLTFVIKK